MSLQKAVFFGAVALALSACGSSGNGSNTPNSSATNTKIQQPTSDKAAAEKAAAEKAAAERAAAEKAAAEKAAAEKAAAERAAAEKAAAEKAAAEKAAAEKAAAERAAAEKAAAEKAAAEKAAAEKAAAEKAAAEKAAAEKAAAEKAAAEKAAAEKAAAEKAAAEKAAAEKAAAEKAAAEKAAAERKLKINTLVKKAVDLGLTNEEAQTLAEENENADDTSFANAIEVFKAQKIIREIDNAKGIVSANYQNGLNILGRSASSSSQSSCINGRCTTWSGTEVTGKALYNQQYSVVMADYFQREGIENGRNINKTLFSDLSVTGLKTNMDKIPNLGTATYKGEAFDAALNRGSLSYSVDFGKRTGSGSIIGLGEQIELQQGSISGTGISAGAAQNGRTGSYLLDFFGKSAEEIAGKVQFEGNDSVGFGGKRGEITQ